MPLESSTSGRACLLEWHDEITVASIFTLLSEVHRAHSVAGAPPLVILHVASAVPTPPSHVLRSLEGGLASMIGACEGLVVALGGEQPDRALLRAAFTDGVSRSSANRLTLFSSLQSAFAHAQRLAPHDVLELQRHVMRRSIPPT